MSEPKQTLPERIEALVWSLENRMVTHDDLLALDAIKLEVETLAEKCERLERAGRHIADCYFAGTEVEFRCERCVESRAVLEGREP